MKYHIWTIGCQMNTADSRQLASALERLGYGPTDHAQEADVVVLNTCVVRRQAEDKVYGRLGSLKSLKERRPDVTIGVMGCLVGIKDPGPLRDQFPWVDTFMPPSDPSQLLDYMIEGGLVDEGRALSAQEEIRRLALHEQFALPAQDRGRLVTAHVPAVLGCSHACTYCIIPYRRGPERSRLAEDIIRETRALADQGVKEITLLGQIVDRYGYDLLPGGDREPGPRPARPPLATLLENIDAIEGLERVRFLTSHPNWMNDQLLETVASLTKVCEQIEVPVQAGDDQILSNMRRGYTSDDYRQLIQRIRQRIPGVSIVTDVIVGFPGETEAQFQNSYDLLAELALDKAHIARYSPRPQTLAARHYSDDVPQEEKEHRRKSLDQLQARISAEINARLIDQEVEVLVEGKRKKRWWGRTRTGKLVFFEDDRDRHGQLASIRVTWTGPWSIIGEPADSPSRA
jgi:tRNA-2-methylthio-N6-dimethylallyladenosine synthase